MLDGTVTHAPAIGSVDFGAIILLSVKKHSNSSDPATHVMFIQTFILNRKRIRRTE